MPTAGCITRGGSGRAARRASAPRCRGSHGRSGDDRIRTRGDAGSGAATKVETRVILEPIAMNKLTIPCLVALSIAVMTTAVANDDKHVVTDPAATKIVCKKQQVMGTRIPKRVCKTQGQID